MHQARIAEGAQRVVDGGERDLLAAGAGGVEKAFGLRPDLVTGPATSTSAAVDLVRRLTGVEGLNVMDPDSLPQLRDVLKKTLNL